MKLKVKEVIKNIVYSLSLGRLIRKGNSDSLYITYDDGPHPVNTLKILEILDKYNVKATFFMVGKEMIKYPDIVNQVINQKHTIGYHSFNHKSMKKITFRAIVKDIYLSKLIMQRFDYKLSYYRPPFGDLTFFGLIWVLFNGFRIVMWSKDSCDSFESKAKVLSNVASNKLVGGDVLLFHDDYTDFCLLDEALSDYQTNSVNCSSFKL